MKRIHYGFVLAAFLMTGSVPSLAQNKKEYGFVGTKNCRKCHLKEYRSWRETKMAKAFDLLKPGERAKAKKEAGLDPKKDYTEDPECVACHVTGYGKPGGFVSLEQTPNLSGVGCEVCHGAGSEYVKPQHMSLKNKRYKLAEVVKVGLLSPVTEEACTDCHNKKSPFFKPFDFAERKSQGTHKHFPLKYKHE
ncbi:MAG: cytochrome c family protein [Acidobacteriota bacterium]